MNDMVRKTQAALQIKKTICVRIYGTSMMPLINEGDIVQAKVIDREIRVGDVVLLEYNGHFICHRVYALLDDGRYCTKGDHNTQPDSIIAKRKNILALICL